MEKYNSLKELIATTEKDAEAFYTKGNNAAGTRLRNALQQIKMRASEIRKDVTETRNAKNK